MSTSQLIRSLSLAALGLLGASSAFAQTGFIFGLTIEDNPGNPLSRIVEFQTVEEAVPLVEVTGAGESFIVPSTGTLTAVPGTLHRVGLVGLVAETEYTVRVSATFGANSSATERQAIVGTEIFAEDFESGGFGAWTFVSTILSETFSTAALPADYPPIVVVTSEPDEMEPGYTLMPVHQGPNQFNLTARLHAIDAAGNIVWAYDPGLPSQLDELTQLSNGDFVFLSVTGLYRQVDFMGNTVLEIDDEDLGTPLLHHDVQELPNGNLVSLGLRIETFPYPDFCSLRPTEVVDYNLVSDTIIEFTREGEFVSEIDLLPSISPYRVPRNNRTGFCLGVYNNYFDGIKTKDLTHANGLVYDASDDSYIVSMRNQNMIIKIDRVTHALIWVIGEDIDSSNADDAWPFLIDDGPFEYFSQQHGLELYDDGHISFYDNSNEDLLGGEESRAVELFPQPELSKVTEVWSFLDPDYDPPLFSVLAGSAIRYDGGTVLVADSALFESGLVFWIRIAEVRQSDNQKVFEIQIPAERGVNDRDWIGYNASRIKSLYPPVPEGS